MYLKKIIPGTGTKDASVAVQVRLDRLSLSLKEDEMNIQVLQFGRQCVHFRIAKQ